MKNKLLIEYIVPFAVVQFGCGAAVIAGEPISFARISYAFGLALIGMVNGFGQLSGRHIIPVHVSGNPLLARGRAPGQL